MRANCTLYLFDIEQNIQNQETGDRFKNVANYVKINGEKSTVGMSTFWSASSANVQLDYSVLIRLRMYNKQKYLYMDNELYDIYNASKADNPINIRLNVRLLKNEELKGLIENAMELL